jgi:hypothetical protein
VPSRQQLIAICFGLFAAYTLIPDVMSWSWGWGHPVEDGTQMLFQVTEEDAKIRQRYGVKARFKARPEGGYRLDINTPHGVRLLNLDEESLEPTADRDNDHLEFPTLSGVEVRPAMIWLPYGRRGPTLNCLTGVVMGLTSYGSGMAWEVAHQDGTFYFDEETGMLSGFQIQVGHTKIEARLRSLY